MAVVPIGVIFDALGAAGAAYTAMAAQVVAARRWTHAPEPPPGLARADAPVSVLKPLAGADASLKACLRTLFEQDYRGPVQVVFGVRDISDPAVKVVRELQREHPGSDITLVVDPRQHGHNGKASNLANMQGAARHALLVIADSDIRVGCGYLREVTAPFADADVGFVTTLYTGEPAGRPWAALSAAGVNYHFLPNVLVGARLGMAQPCLGATVALRREVLERVGGFAAVADRLADDYDLGRAVRALGYRGAFAPSPVVHLCTERSWRELWRHEARWARTIRLIDPWGYFGSGVTHPVPWAILACALDFGPWSLATLFAALATRLHLARQVDRATGTRSAGLGLVSARDLLSFGVFLSAFFGDAVSWRGRRYKIGRGGALVPVESKHASHPVPPGALLRRLRRRRGLALSSEAGDPVVLVPDLVGAARGAGRDEPADRRPAA